MEFLTISAVAMAVLAFVTSSIALRTASKSYQSRKLKRELDALSLECADLRDLYGQLLTSHKKMSARWATRARRENGADQPQEQDEQQWKENMNRRLGLAATGLNLKE